MVEAGPGDGANGSRPSFLSSAALTYGTQLLAAVLSLANVLVVARALGPSGRGEVALLTTIAFLTSHVATLGVQEALANIAGAQPARRRTLAGTGVVLALAFGTLAAGIVAGLIELLPAVGGHSDPALRAVTLAVIPLLVLEVYLRFLVQADYGFAASNAAWLVPPILNVVVNSSLAVAGVLSVGTAMITWLAGQAIATGLLVWWVMRRLAGIGRPDARLAREVLAFGVKSHGGRIMLLGNYRLDQWILGSVSGSRELGLYSVAVAWAEALFYLPTALAAVQRPDLVRASRRDAGRQAAQVFRFAAILTIVLGAAIVVAAPLLCVLTFGEEFRGAIDDLRVLAFGGLGVVALKLLGNALTAQGKPLVATAAIGIAFASTIALDVLLIPSYGGTGAAFASSISYTIGGLAIGILACRSLGIRPVELLPRGREPFAYWRSLRSR